MRVHQVLATFAPYDAVSNEAVEIRAVLRAAGYESDIYADGIRPSAHDVVRPLAALEAGAGDVLLVHYSIWSDAVERALQDPARVVVRYHNVTPARWFEGVNEVVASLCRTARARLPELAPRAELAVADSSFNRLDLDDAGFRRSEVVPILVAPAGAGPVRTPSDEHLVVTVGRLVPNKRIDEVAARVRLLPPHLPRRRAARDRRQRRRVRGVRAGVPAARGDARACRTRSSARSTTPAATRSWRAPRCTSSCSEHEGFCVPLVEAMRHGLPIVARDFGAVAETLGGAGVAAPPEAGPAELAELLDLAVTDERLGAAMAAGRAERLATLDPAVVGRRLVELLREVA